MIFICIIIFINCDIIIHLFIYEEEVILSIKFICVTRILNDVSFLQSSKM